MSDSSVNRTLIDSISPIATTNVRPVLAVYMTAGPIIIRTALRSFVARDIRSPVRFRWKKSSESRCRHAKKSFRRSYSMSRDAPTITRRIRNRKKPPPAASRSNSPA